MRVVLAVLLVAHGLIHLVGFAKWWPLMRIPALQGRRLASVLSSPTSSRAFALCWLLACVLLLSGAVLQAQAAADWYRPALGGLALSQILILLVWSDARFGTVANVLVLVPVLVAAAVANFNRECEDRASSLLSDAVPIAQERVQLAELAPLPLPVQRWLDRSGVVGHPRVGTVRLRQEGELRTAPEGAWLPATAEQYFSVAQPGFVWKVHTRMFGVVPVVGRDVYRAGTGSMLIEAAAVFALADANGPKIDTGAMQRFLGETVWFPSAALSPYLVWSPVDDSSAKATFSDHGRSVEARFEYDAVGRVVSIRAQRYLGGSEEAVLTSWLVSCTAWARLSGVEIPVRGDVGWQLPTGYFSYYRWRVLDVEYDPAAPFTDSVLENESAMAHASFP